MTLDQAIATLKEMYQNAQKGNQVLQIHLFGIKFASELEGLSLPEIAVEATGSRSYATEIRKAMRLSEHVVPKN